MDRGVCSRRGILSALVVGVFVSAMSCGYCVSNACRYDLSHKVYVPLVDRHNSATNLPVPLLIAVKKRLHRVGIDIVDAAEPEALRLTMSISKDRQRAGNIGNPSGEQVSMGSNVLDIYVTLQNADGKVIVGPERFTANENMLVGSGAMTTTLDGKANANNLISVDSFLLSEPEVAKEDTLSLSSSGDSFRRAELDAETAKLARQIVQRFFARNK